MTMYDPENPNHQRVRDIIKAAIDWTPEKEAALQRRFDLMGLNGERAKRLAEESAK